MSKKNLFTYKYLAPLLIGLIIAIPGFIFEITPLIYVGMGIHCYGWFVMLKSDD